MPKSKLSAIISLLLVFMSGALVGAVTHRLYTFSAAASEPRPSGGGPPRGPQEDPEALKKRIVADMQSRLDLDADQVAKLNGIYDVTRKQFDELHRKANSETRALWDDQTSRIRAILRSDQLPKYEELRRQRDEERKRRKREQKGPPPPRP